MVQHIYLKLLTGGQKGCSYLSKENLNSYSKYKTGLQTGDWLKDKDLCGFVVLKIKQRGKRARG